MWDIRKSYGHDKAENEVGRETKRRNRELEEV